MKRVLLVDGEELVLRSMRRLLRTKHLKMLLSVKRIFTLISRRMYFLTLAGVI